MLIKILMQGNLRLGSSLSSERSANRLRMITLKSSYLMVLLSYSHLANAPVDISLVSDAALDIPIDLEFQRW